MQDSTNPNPRDRSLTEHLVFIALLIPTFIVLVAAVVSLAAPDAPVVVQPPTVTAAACEPCPRHEDPYPP